jgi:Zn-dependent M28 family amino/carboxypeptidase
MQAGEGRIHLFDQDGELSGSPWTGDPAAWATSGSDPLFLMTGGYDEGTNGIMDEVRGYSRALTETEVLELYTGSGGNV